MCEELQRPRWLEWNERRRNRKRWDQKGNGARSLGPGKAFQGLWISDWNGSHWWWWWWWEGTASREWHDLKEVLKRSPWLLGEENKSTSKETDSEMMSIARWDRQKMNLWLPVGKDGGKGVWDGHAHTAIFKMDYQQGPNIQYMELCLMLCGNLDGRRAWRGMNTCICMTEALCCPPETITTLLISYTPI